MYPLDFDSPSADLRIRLRTTLKDRIAALQANSGLTPSAASSRSPSPAPSAQSDSAGSNSNAKGIVSGTRLKDKIARFDRFASLHFLRSSMQQGRRTPIRTIMTMFRSFRAGKDLFDAWNDDSFRSYMTILDKYPDNTCVDVQSPRSLVRDAGENTAAVLVANWRAPSALRRPRRVDFALTTLSSAVGALEGAVVTLAVVVAAVAGVDCEERSVSRVSEG